MNEYGADRSWPFAEGGGTTILVFTGLLGIAIALWLTWSNLLTGTLLFLAAALYLLILYFFRDPNRKIVAGPDLVVGPGDGTIVEIVREPETRYLNDNVFRISMFLSITNVHVQRIPMSGKVLEVKYEPGKFLQAFKPEASDVNENIGMVLETAYGKLLVKQIAGIVARRCVNFAQPGDEVKTGQRYGLIRFGSRIDLFLPATAQVLVNVGDRVTGGLTPIAKLTKTGLNS